MSNDPTLAADSLPSTAVATTALSPDQANPLAPTSWSDWLASAGQGGQDLLSAGGPVVGLLGVLSVVALAIVLLKVWQFAALRLGRNAPVQAALAHWYQRDGTAALAALAGQPQPAAVVLQLALSGLLRPGVDQALLREELVRVATAHLEQLRGYLRALEVIATLAPLLGLLGTVLGMIGAFQQLQAAGSQVDPALLSGGIWEALLTTAVGLAVAIPAVLAHGWLERRVERCGHQMEDAVTRAFTRDLGLGAPADAGAGAPLAAVEDAP